MLLGAELDECECAVLCEESYRDMSPTCVVGTLTMECWDVLKGSWASVWAASRRIRSFEGYEGDVALGFAE